MKCQGEFIFKDLIQDCMVCYDVNGNCKKFSSIFKMILSKLNEENLNTFEIEISDYNYYHNIMLKMRNLKPNDKVLLDCEIVTYNNSLKVILVDINKIQ